VVNGWRLHYHPIFKKQLTSLKNNVKKLKEKVPDGYKAHPKTKLLASVHNAITKTVPADPGHKDFRQGNALGKGNGHWCRVKNGIPNRYRLFFRFIGKPPVIIFSWMNDETTLRKEGAKTDCYEVFKKMLKKGTVPDSIEKLMSDTPKEVSD